eukprot:TRINITY_DN20179_c0_g1_i4.p1 TRINITY_DN20179_c0_g1~~TRINITY_DN20179_c0_g1_i4.p1  ORF type:complete len:161 (+),score=44.63 TRINITY_DN20179_c0_g1_i4:52-534(+)
MAVTMKRPAGSKVRTKAAKGTGSGVARKKSAATSRSKRPAANASKLLKLRPKKRYFALRHGESEANVAGIIISDPKVGTKRYGLTKKGIAAVRVSAAAFAKKVTAQRPFAVEIIASDFKRTMETARTFRSALLKELRPWRKKHGDACQTSVGSCLLWLAS